MKKYLLLFVFLCVSLNFAQSLSWWNLQWPASAPYAVQVYGRVYGLGITEAPGQNPGLIAWVGYSTSNTNPNTWTNWILADYNYQHGNDDEYRAILGLWFPKGTYYYAYRFQYQSEPYVYGGFSGPWDGTTNVSGVLTIFAEPINTPTALTGFSTQPKKVELSWNDNATNETNYLVMRKAGDTLSTSGYGIVATIPQNSTSFTDTIGLSDETQYSYYVYANNTDTVSGRSNYVTVFTVVPVELTSFTYSVKEKGVELNWTTASEKNNKGFEVERNQNGIWENIGFVEGNGTSTEVNQYKFIDNSFNKAAQNIKYRLRQIDFDGSFEYSNLVNVSRDITKYMIQQNYPNPFNPSTKINYQVPVTSPVKLDVYDGLGNLIKTIVNEIKPSGNYQIELNLSEYGSGVYLYRLTVGDFIETKKMMMIK